MNKEYIKKEIERCRKERERLEIRIEVFMDILREMGDDEYAGPSFSDIIQSVLNDSNCDITALAGAIGYGENALYGWKAGRNIPVRSKWGDIAYKIKTITDRGITQEQVMEALKHGLEAKKQGDN